MDDEDDALRTKTFLPFSSFMLPEAHKQKNRDSCTLAWKWIKHTFTAFHFNFSLFSFPFVPSA